MLDLACGLNALDIADRIRVDGDQLVTRPVGKRFRLLLEEHLLACNTNRCILSFAKIRLVDSSFADEALATLAAERSQRVVSWPCFLLRDLTPVSRENLDMALLSRPVRQPGLRNCVLPVILDSG